MKGSAKKNKGFTLIEIMIVVAVLALLATIAVPGLLRARATSHDASAKATLKTIASAAEEYAADHDGNYPEAVTDLTNAQPPYLNDDYTDSARNGFNFACDWGTESYGCSALPITNGTTGTKSYTVTSGIILAENDAVASEGAGEEEIINPPPPPPSAPTFDRGGW